MKNLMLLLALAMPVGLVAVSAQTSKLYELQCLSCHGPLGDGDGKVGKYLSPKPRNFMDAKWQSSRSDAQITTVISAGGKGLKLSETMPAFQTTLSKAEIKALVGMVRSFKIKKTAAQKNK